MTERDQDQNQETKPEIEIDQFRHERFLQDIRDNQNLPTAVLAGLAATVAGAGVWALITAITQYQIGFMAVGIGFLVGYTVRHFGKGIDKQFGIAGAIIALAGCVVGNILAICIMASQEFNVGVVEILKSLDKDVLLEIFREDFSMIDIIFYGLAIHYGYKTSFRKITEEEMAKLAK
ncbi:MAG: hypothetical protein GY841_17440 [FCB group bacterium]|nr:hypothetical protein [FCB group bacterium]